jgi:hypothetical protein
MLLLPEGQKKEAWQASKNRALSEIVELWVEKYFYLVVSRFYSVFKQTLRWFPRFKAATAHFLTQSSLFKFITIKFYALKLKIMKLNLQAKDMQRLDEQATILSFTDIAYPFQSKLTFG